MGMGRAVGYRDNDQHVGIVTVGAKRFGTVENPGISFANGCHSGAACVRSGGGLGQSPRPDVFTSSEFRNVFLFLLLSSRQNNVIRAQRRVGGDNDSDGTIYPGEFVDRG